MEAFKHRVKESQKLKCYVPRRKSDEETTLMTMDVIGIYPHILTMGYWGKGRKRLYTSMTWAEAVMLNRMSQEELFLEVRQMQQERGLPYHESPVREPPSRKRKIDRQNYTPLIVAYRDAGMTYAQIAAILRISASLARDIYLKEGQEA